MFQRFATVDAISDGRAEVILGRGSFTESFPLFGFDLADYETLFEDKLEEFAALARGESVRGGQIAYPRTASDRLRTWIGVGGSPGSVLRAADHGLPLMLAIIGGDPARVAPYVDLHRRALSELGHEPLPIGVHSPGHIAPTDEQAREELWPHFKVQRDRIGAERGWGAVTRHAFEQEAGPHGSLYVGAPETVARKIAATVSTLGIDRFDLKYSNGPMPHDWSMRAIELYGTEVAPRVRELLAEPTAIAV